MLLPRRANSEFAPKDPVERVGGVAVGLTYPDPQNRVVRAIFGDLNFPREIMALNHNGVQQRFGALNGDDIATKRIALRHLAHDVAGARFLEQQRRALPGNPEHAC